MDIKFYSKCNGDSEYETQECENLELDKEVVFKASITLDKCPTSNFDKTITIFPEGITETFQINVKMLCDCPCNQINHPDYETNSAKCEHSGNFACGKCLCNPGKYGNRCECDKKNDFKYEYECREETTSEICSRNGYCNCGVCECFTRTNGPKITGKYCQCTNDNCLNNCSDHGTCDCGTCKCDPGFEEEDCNCDKNTETCIGYNSTICSGHGQCNCGGCNCTDGYFGQYCEESFSDKCTEYKNCVECKVFGTGLLNETCGSNCTCDVKAVDKIEEFPKELELCEEYDSDDCSFKFLLPKRETKLLDLNIHEIMAVKHKSCSTAKTGESVRQFKNLVRSHS